MNRNYAPKKIDVQLILSLKLKRWLGISYTIFFLRQSSTKIFAVNSTFSVAPRSFCLRFLAQVIVYLELVLVIWIFKDRIRVVSWDCCEFEAVNLDLNTCNYACGEKHINLHS